MDILKVLKDRIQGKAPPGKRRSPQWRSVRAKHLEDHPRCAVCGTTKKVEVHHILPFAMFPDKELEPKNLITLCENGKYGVRCHQHYGHLGNYGKFNLNVEIDAETWRRKLGVYDGETKA